MDIAHCFKVIVHRGRGFPNCLGDSGMECDHTHTRLPPDGSCRTDTRHCCGCEDHIVSDFVVMATLFFFTAFCLSWLFVISLAASFEIALDLILISYAQELTKAVIGKLSTFV